MDAVFTLRIRVADDSDAAAILEDAHQLRQFDDAWWEVSDMIENHEVPDDDIVVEDLEIIR